MVDYEKIKSKVIELYCNTHSGVKSIIKEVAPNGEIKDVCEILSNYEKES
ncbi:MAG: hypothetical protein K6B70_00195 [Clostridia bacterium]|nr:hypothetical protein [Clostridia bacterium]